MKKIRNGVFLLFLCFLGMIGVVHAACDYDTQIKLNTEAANVKASYEVKTVIIDDNGNIVAGASEEDASKQDSIYSLEDRVYVSIYNITNNLKFVITNDNGNVGTYDFSNTDNGTYIFEVKNTDKIDHYVIQIESNNNNCIGDKLRTINLTTPKFNELSSLSVCIDSDSYYCKKWTDTEINMTYDEVIDAENNKKSSEQNESNTVSTQKFWNKYGIYIIIGSIVIIIGVVTTVIVKKRQRSSVL